MKKEAGNIKEDTQQDPPKHLYRYYPIDDYTESIFVNNEVYFSPPTDFSDPFDSKVNSVIEGTPIAKKLFLKKMLKKTLSYFPEEIKEISNDPNKIKVFEERMQKLVGRHRSKMGVFCTSIKRDNILMWSHYAQQHEGFCLEFNTKLGFFQRSFPVIYNHKMPKFNFLRYKETKEEKISLVMDHLLSKAKGWEYEQEWRVVNSPDLGGHGTFKLPEESLTGVIFGFKISEKNKRDIISWCQTRKHKPNLYMAHPKKEEYGLVIEPIEHE